MWALFRGAKTIQTDEIQSGDNGGRSFNVNEEYLCAFRTKSYSDFFLKAQELVKEPPSPSSNTFAEILLEPGQETITAILDSSKFPDLNPLLSKFFEISAEASKFCTTLLETINHLQSHYNFIQHALHKIHDDDCAVSELRIILDNPFSDLEKQISFTRIRDEYSTMLRRLKSKRKPVARKMGAAVLSIPLKPLKKLTNMRGFLKRGILRKVGGEELDVAAKGTYIVNTDLETISRLVWRLQDEMEHNKAIIKLCLDKKEDRFSVKVVVLMKEMKKNSVGLGKQVEELQQHLYLCLVTINRLRALLINQIAKSNSFNL
nr:UPF0496 protein At1g20180-like [Ipomoea batatas]